MRILLRCLGFFCILFLGCSKIDPKIEVPAYIEIDDYNVVTDNATQGTSDQSFTNVLVLTSSDNLGYYPLPARIPILKNGDTHLNIRPAILVNGVKFLRVDYPVMAGYDTIFPLKEGQVLKVKPTFKYYGSTTFPVLEDFEQVNTYMINSDPTDTITTKIDQAHAVYGSKCLSMHLDAAHPTSQIQSVTGFSVSTTSNAYLELNYKGNIALEVGVIGSSSQGIIINPEKRSPGGVNPSDAWKKLYINLSEIIRYPPAHSWYFLYMSISQSSDPTQGSPQVYIDNVKVVRQ
jgi:hypothetical protein